MAEFRSNVSIETNNNTIILDGFDIVVMILNFIALLTNGSIIIIVICYKSSRKIDGVYLIAIITFFDFA